MNLSAVYLGRGAPLVSSVVVPVEVHQIAVLLLGFLPALGKGLSSECSQRFLEALPGLLAETLERRGEGDVNTTMSHEPHYPESQASVHIRVLS